MVKLQLVVNENLKFIYYWKLVCTWNLEHCQNSPCKLIFHITLNGDPINGYSRCFRSVTVLEKSPTLCTDHACTPPPHPHLLSARSRLRSPAYCGRQQCASYDSEVKYLSLYNIRPTNWPTSRLLTDIPPMRVHQVHSGADIQPALYKQLHHPSSVTRYGL